MLGQINSSQIPEKYTMTPHSCQLFSAILPTLHFASISASFRRQTAQPQASSAVPALLSFFFFYLAIQRNTAIYNYFNGGL